MNFSSNIEHVMLLHKNNVMIFFKFYCFALQFGLDLQDKNSSGWKKINNDAFLMKFQKRCDQI